MSAYDGRLRDVIGAAEDVIRTLQAAPPHVRPWLRGIEAEAERVALEAAAVRNRAARRFLSWTLLGMEPESTPRDSVDGDSVDGDSVDGD